MTVLELKLAVLNLAVTICIRPNVSCTNEEIVETAKILEKYITEGAIVNSAPVKK